MSRPCIAPRRPKSARSTLAGLALAAGATLALAAPAAAENGVTIYSANDAAEIAGLEAQIDQRGYNLLASEAFERFGTMDDPLDSSGNLVYRPGEIPAGLTFQSNRLAGGGQGPNPVGRDALNVSGAYQEYGPPQPQLRTTAAGSSLDILVDAQKYSALKVGTPLTGEISVFDTTGRLLDSEPLDGRRVTGYAGVVAEPGVRIGRVNITEPSSSDEHIVEAHAYGAGQVAAPQPQPAPAPKPRRGGLLGGLFGR